MEFAEWVVSGLDQLRLGQLPGGNDFYQAASAGLGGDPRLNAYMNSGGTEARAELVQVIADAVTANPGFEQQLRSAAAAAQSTGAGSGKPPFLKTTNGLLVLVAAGVVVVGGGIALAVGLGGGDGGGAVAQALKGTWSCQAPGQSTDGEQLTFTVGDGTWSAGEAHGTWKQDGDKVTVTDAKDSGNNLTGTGVPSSTGPFSITVASAKHSSNPSEVAIVQGQVSAHRLTVNLAGNTGLGVTLVCTK